MKKKFIWLLLAISMLSFISCGSSKSSEEAKALLEHNLKLVGIPPEIVVNICQDTNDNGSCDEGELQAKIRVNQNDTIAQMWEKIKLTDKGEYILENYDPTKNIIMEIRDESNLKYDNGKLALIYNPDTEELSVLQAIIDADFLKKADTEIFKELKNREKIDKILLDALRVNQNRLKDENLSTSNALAINLEEIAKGLNELNISEELPNQLDACKNDEECIQTIVETTIKEVEVTKEEAKELARSKSLVDGYIIKLNKPVIALCANGKEYESLLTIKKKGKILFKKFPVGTECNLTVFSGATIDSNNNRKLDKTDKTLEFNMVSSTTDVYITPLTTLLFEKRKKGEDVNSFSKMIQNFDPVVAPYRSVTNVSIEKLKIQKLIILMEVLKTSMRQSIDISLLDLTDIITTKANENIDDFNIDKLIAKFPDEIKTEIEEKVAFTKELLNLFQTLDIAKISLNTLFVNISDGGKNLEDSMSKSLLVQLPNGVTLEDFVAIKIKSDDNTTTSKNKVPICDAGKDIKSKKGESITFDASKSKDRDGKIVSYIWKEGDKTLSEKSTFTKDDFSIGMHTIILTITDDDGAVSSDKMLITVVEKEIINKNKKPTAKAGEDQRIEEGKTVSFDASKSKDSDGKIVTYEWKEGKSILSKKKTFTKDDFSIGIHTIILSISDNDGAISSDKILITVVEKEPINKNKKPTSKAGEDQRIEEGKIVTFDASKSKDSDGKIVAYEWKEKKTILSKKITFTKDDFPVGIHTIILTITDNDGAISSDKMIITVVEKKIINKNKKPTAKAGEDQEIEEGETITFDASKSKDSDGKIVAYQWSKKGVILSNKQSFSSNDFIVGEQIITLKVTDNDGSVAQDTITISVVKVNQAPIARAGVDQEVEEGTNILFYAGESTDSDGDIVAYEWTYKGVVLSEEQSFSKNNFLEGEHVITLKVTDDGGLTAEDTVSIIILPKK